MIEKKPMYDQDSDRKGITFPNVFPITLSHAELPSSHKMMEESGMAFGCLITPFIGDDSINRREAQRNYGNASRVARCSHCAAYLNPYCDANNQRWFCSLCGQRNVFQRSQTRYRQVDMKLLPETQDVLVDYRMPIVDSVADPLASGALQYNSMPSDLRPLVHVFLIQESMKIDNLQSVIDSLSQTVPTMHPDIKIVLLTFSNRIGIYNFTAESSVPSVQYVHFTAANSESGECSVLEGHDMHEIAPDYDVSLMMPLSTVATFHSTAARIGSCSEAFTSAMTSLFDAYPAETPFSNNDELLPKMMLGPVLEALGDWILDPPSLVDNDDSTGLVVTDEDDFHATGLDEPRQYGSTLQEGIAQLFGKLGLGGAVSAAAAAVGNRGGAVGGGAAGANLAAPDILNVHNRQNAPIDLCNGVILHLFVDSPQNLKPGSHDSVAAAPPTASTTVKSSEMISVPYLMDAEWTDQLANRFAEKSLTVNLWAVTSYYGQDIGLSVMDPLVHLTGGSINRIILGWYPKDERERLTESLRRTLNAMQATRCLLKLRASPMIEFIESDASGTFLVDKNFPGVYRMGSCTPEKAFGFPFTYKVNSRVGHPDDKENAGNTVALQLAFSYETLIEGDKGLQIKEKERKDVSNEVLDGFLDSALNILELSEVKKAVSEFNDRGSQPANVARRRFAPRGYRSPATPSGGGGEGAAADEVTRDCPYDRSRQLMSVKYLRIVTILVECTNKPIKLFQAAHLPTVLALNARLAFNANRRHFLQENAVYAKHDVAHSASSLPTANKLNVQNAGIKQLVNFTIQWLVSFTKCSLAAKSDKTPDKMSFGQLLKLPNIDGILHELQDNEPLVHDVVLHTFAAMDLLDSLLLKSSYLCDELSEFNYLLQSSDAFNASRLLYPRLVPLASSDLMLEKYSIVLSRAGMLTQAPTSKYFLLDAGTELIVYKSIMGGAMGSQSAASAAGEEVDLMSNFRPVKTKTVDSSNNNATTDADEKDGTKAVNDATQEVLYKSNKLGFFLLNYLKRRIQCAPVVPRVYLCDAGTQSSSFFTKHLVEERCRSGLIEYRQFKELIIEVVKSSC